MWLSDRIQLWDFLKQTRHFQLRLSTDDMSDASKGWILGTLMNHLFYSTLLNITSMWDWGNATFVALGGSLVPWLRLSSFMQDFFSFFFFFLNICLLENKGTAKETHIDIFTKKDKLQ